MRTNFQYKDRTSSICYYCGELPQSVDHCPAIAEVDRKGIEYFKKERIPLILISACYECNQILSDHSIHTLSARKLFIKKALLKKYKKILAMPTWEEEELRELSDELRYHVEIGLKAKSAISLRILW